MKSRGKHLEDVKKLEEFSKKFNRCVVVTFSIDADGQAFHVTTYGKTKKLCKLAEAYGDQIFQAILDGDIVAPTEEPEDKPDDDLFGAYTWV